MYPTLIRCLKSLSPDVRRRMAAHHGLEKEEPEGLARRLTYLVHLRSFVQRMNTVEREGMDFFLFYVGEDVCTESKLREWERVYSTPPARVRITLVRLRQWGFLYGLHRKWGETVYWCPPEIRQAWLEVNRKRPPFLPTTRARILSREMSGRGVWQALFHFLVLCDRERIPLTQEGKIYLRWQKRLASELGEWEEGLQDTPWAGQQEPAAVRLVLDLARVQGLVRERGNTLEVDPARLSRWLTLSWEERIGRLYGLTRFRLLEDRPDWDCLARLMEGHRSEEWVSASMLLDEWVLMVGKKAKRIEGHALVRHWLKPLCRLGWIELATSSRGILWRWTPFAPVLCQKTGKEIGTVQPDFDVLIPPFFPLDHRWRLTRFADYVGGDHLSVYRIHAGSVERAREKGMTEEEMIDLLEQSTGGRVPANVKVGIRQWCRKVGRIVLRHALLVEGADEELIEELERIPELEEIILERVGPKVLIADKSREEELGDRLKQLGFPPRREAEKPLHFKAELPEEHDRDDPEPAGYTVENRYPEVTEALPGVRHLPRMWTSGIHSYHPATVQDMVRRAIQMRLDLRVKEDAGDVRQLTPRHLENREGVWMLEGKEGDRRVRIDLSRIGGLQIQLPE